MDKNSFANRLRALRGFLGFSRQEFSQRHGVPEITLKYWELSKSQISETQLKKLINAFLKEGVYCTKEWLISGEGSSPFANQNNENCWEEGSQAEADFFLKNNDNSIIQIVIEKNPFAFYSEGDIVGGIKINIEEESISSFYAIVFLKKTSSNALFKAYINETHDIVLINNHENFLINPQIDRIYKIVWWRKGDVAL
ncbi:MAG: helix-turn-helix domain-containing protein [Alphaproteobacteria bacterium]